MAINTNPTYKAGQKLDPEQLKALLALRDNGPQWGETTGNAGGQRYDINQWYMPGKFGAVVVRDPQTGKTLIAQARNTKDWGSNNVSDVWDDYLAVLKSHALMAGGVSKFRYLDYYDALGTTRGCLGGFRKAVALMAPPGSWVQRQEYLPALLPPA